MKHLDYERSVKLADLGVWACRHFDSDDYVWIWSIKESLPYRRSWRESCPLSRLLAPRLDDLLEALKEYGLYANMSVGKDCYMATWMACDGTTVMERDTQGDSLLECAYQLLLIAVEASREMAGV